MVSRAKDPQYLPGGQDGRDRVKAAGEGLAENQDIRPHPLPVAGQEFSAAAQAGLNLVGHQQDAVAGADFPHLAEIPRRRDDHAPLPLNRFHQESDGMGGDGLLQGPGVAVGDGHKAGGERAEAFAVLRFAGETDDGDGAAVKVPGADDHLGPVRRHPFDRIAPLAGRLQRRLHRLGPRVHQEHHLIAGQFAQLLLQKRQLVVAEGAGGEGEPAGLLGERPQEAGVAVPLVDGRVGAQEIHVAPPLHIPHPHSLRPADHHIQRPVVVGAVGFFQGDVLLCLHSVLLF